MPPTTRGTRASAASFPRVNRNIATSASPSAAAEGGAARARRGGSQPARRGAALIAAFAAAESFCRQGDVSEEAADKAARQQAIAV